MSAARAYTTGASADHVTRYPIDSEARRTIRLLAMERAYNPATNATDGSIIAAIIKVQMPAKVGRSAPIVPGMPTPGLTKIVPAEASAPAPATAAAYGAIWSQGLRSATRAELIPSN